MKILVVNYSQSGQLDDILDNFLNPLKDYSIERINVKLKENYPFPWTKKVFFNAMPETVLEEEMELQPLPFKEEKYDLVVFGYQPWFLSPSRPATSILKNKEFIKRLKDTPVLTIIGARNMWLNAQESVKKYIYEAGGKLVGNIALIDKAQNQISAITIMHWMFTGKKTKKWGILPLPGISDNDIKGASKFGEIVKSSITNNNYDNLQELLLKNNAVIVKTTIMFVELRAKKIFKIWANLIKRKGTTEKKRLFWVNFFRFYLQFALFIVAPIVLLIYIILIVPFTLSLINRKKQYFSGVKLIENA